MNALVNVKRAVETRLASAFPSVKIAWENTSFNPPKNELYFAVQMVVLDPDEPVIGSTYYRERISLQVFVADASNKGNTNALNKANEVRDLFNKGLYLEQDGTRIHITRVPTISTIGIVEDRYVLMVNCLLWAEVFKDEVV